VAQLVDELVARRLMGGRAPLRAGRAKPFRRTPPATRGVREVVDAGQEDEQPVTLVLQGRKRLPKVAGGDGDPSVARADASFDDEGVRDHCRGVIPWALIRSCRIISAFSRSSG